MPKYKVGTLLRLKTHEVEGNTLFPAFTKECPVGTMGLVGESALRRTGAWRCLIQTINPPTLTYWLTTSIENFWEVVREPDDDVAV